jgi:hypothetical protein
MEYQVVYDASQEGYSWWWLLIPILLIIVGIISWRRREALKSRINLPIVADALGSSALGCGLLLIVCLTIIGFLVSYTSYSNAQQILQTGEIQVVEGQVENFIPQPAFDNGVESFTVNGVGFKYSAATISHGFNQSSTHGGPINRNGIQVRISYYDDQSGDNVILKLEVAQQ